MRSQWPPVACKRSEFSVRTRVRSVQPCYSSQVLTVPLPDASPVGTTAPAIPAAVHLLKLQTQQRTRSAGAAGATPAAAASPPPSPTAGPLALHPPPSNTASSAKADLSNQLDAFEALTSPLAAALAADAYENDDDDDDDDDDDVSDAVALLTTRGHSRPTAGVQPKGQQQASSAKLVDPDAQARAALSRGASAKALAMAKKLDELSVEHADLTRQLSAS